ncbi:MAG: hypothetical protein WA082_03735 [Candidatus Moraniibacteriota bacterium]
MYQYHKFLFIGVLAVFVTLGFSPVAQGAGEEASESSGFLSCTPKAEVVDGKGGPSFALSSGEATTFNCLAKQMTKGEAVTVMLLGKQAYGTEAPAASASTLFLADTAVATTLTFPAAYQPGKYTYTFSLIDTVTQKVIASEIPMTGTLKGTEQAKIGTMSIKEKNPLWGSAVTLNLALSLPEGQTLETDPIMLRIIMQDKQGKECVVLVENQAVTQVGGTNTLTLPQEGSCANMLSVTLSTADGKMLDQKTLAVGIAEKSTVNVSELSRSDALLARIPWILLVGFVVTSVLVLALFGYFLIRKHRGY